MSEICFFKNAKNSFTLSGQVFDVACYPWRIVRFGSYKFVRIDLSANVLYIMVAIGSFVEG